MQRICCFALCYLRVRAKYWRKAKFLNLVTSTKKATEIFSVAFCFAAASLSLPSTACSSFALFDLIKLLGGKSCFGDRNVLFWKAEIGKLVISDSDHITDLVPIIIGI